MPGTCWNNQANGRLMSVTWLPLSFSRGPNAMIQAVNANTIK